VVRYTDFTQANDGDPVDIEDGYVTDYVRDKTGTLIRDHAAATQPFFVWSSYVAPHLASVVGDDGQARTAPPIPAPRHAGRYDGVPADVFDKRAYNEPNLRDKPSPVQRDKVIDARVQEEFTGRIESLAAVDEAVAATFEALETAGVLDQTLIVFTSDNGYLLGEHRRIGKTLAYEESVRIPFLVASPTLPRGEHSRRTVSILDLAATIVDATNARAGRRLDGRSFLNATAVDPSRRTMLVQGGNDGARRRERMWNFRGIRGQRYTYVRWYTGEEELYDRRNDPFQLDNRASRVRYRDVVTWARRATRKLGHCAGASCRREPPSPPPVRR
jgi:arylsulfatase A-like enzyme